MTERVLEYEPTQSAWRISRRFIFALLISCVGLFLGGCLLMLIRDALTYRGAENYAMLLLALFGFPAFLIQMACLVVPMAIGFGEKRRPWRRSQWIVLLLMGVVSIFLPLVGLFLYAK
jgi:hypothetical protein